MCASKQANQQVSFYTRKRDIHVMDNKDALASKTSDISCMSGTGLSLIKVKNRSVAFLNPYQKGLYFYYLLITNINILKFSF